MLVSRAWKAVVSLMLLFMFSSVWAENWKDVALPEKLGVLQFDIDSITDEGPGEMQVSWKSASSRISQEVTFTTAAVRCQDLMYSLVNLRTVEPSAGMVKANGAYKKLMDYVAKTDQWYSAFPARPMLESDYVTRHRFPSLASAEGMMLQELCMANPAEWTVRKAKFVANIQGKLPDCPVKPASPLCRTDPQTVDTLYGAWMRIEQAKQAFPERAEGINKLLLAKLDDAARCKVTGDCLRPLNDLQQGLGMDMSRKISGSDKTTYLNINLELLATQESNEAAQAHYRTCVTQAIPNLDDHTSPADVIATAVFATCRAQLPALMASSPGSEISAKPYLIAQVLTARKNKATSAPTTSNNRKTM